MRKLGGGCLTATAILLSLLLAVMAWGYLKYPSYLTSFPSDQSICGKWLIDPDLTTGYQASHLLPANHLRHGYLELTPDRRFTIEAMPTFWEHPVSSRESSSASGTWRLEVDNNGWAMLNLYFERIDNRKAGEWDWGHSYIRRQGSGYFLFFIVDFDSSDFFVLRKSP